MNIAVAALVEPPIAEHRFEIVEHKGLGHPDTLCDALAEHLSVTLSRFYLERFGAILHHNVDKALLWGGAARPAFGGGELLAPIEIYLAGRATTEFRGVRIPVDELAIEASLAWLREHLNHIDVERHIRIMPRIRSTSPDLAALFLRQHEQGEPLANDTSFGVGFAPLDALEQTVLAVGRHLNSPHVRRCTPAIGEDIKVMGTREGDAVSLTVACAVVGSHVANLDAYNQVKVQVAALASDAARSSVGAAPDVRVNTADGDEPDSVYLTVTGLSAESGDDGQVGRGNRVNGLITPYRPMSLEAAAGKNPVTHVGKLYNVIATRAAQAIVDGVPGVTEAYCYLVSRIGAPISKPQLFEVKVRCAEPGVLAHDTGRITALARAELARINMVWRDAVDDKLGVY
jgi:S-adenosylmethionine synthetase